VYSIVRPGRAGAAAARISRRPRRTRAPARQVDLELATATTGAAFGEAAKAYADLDVVFAPAAERGLEFHTFDHPYCAEYVRELDRGGVARLLAADTSLLSDDGADFEAGYDRNLPQYVSRPTSRRALTTSATSASGIRRQLLLQHGAVCLRARVHRYSAEPQRPL
jgi:hypothetical protein